jgi:nucleotidyltransferase/DNA polymerase involved in DNA repair
MQAGPLLAARILLQYTLPASPASLCRLLRTFPAAAVVEKASIDEAYVLVRPPGGGAGGGPGGSGDASGSGHPADPQQAQQLALQLAADIRAATQAQLGLTVSVGEG